MLRVFLVEDDQSMVSLLLELLPQEADVTCVGYAAEEVAAVTWLITQRDHWDLAIVDLMLAEGSGLRVLSSCRVHAHHQHMVVLSNHVTRDTTRRCLDLGAEATFDKATGCEKLLAYCRDLARQQPARP